MGNGSEGTLRLGHDQLECRPTESWEIAGALFEYSCAILNYLLLGLNIYSKRHILFYF